MIKELNGILTNLQESWDWTETPSTVTFTQSNLSESEVERVLDQVQDLRAIINGRNLIFKVHETRGVFDYRVNWETTNNFSVTQDRDRGTDGPDLFNRGEVITALEALRDNQIGDYGSFQNVIGSFAENEYVDVEFNYRINTSEISEFIETNRSDIESVQFYFETGTFLESISTMDLQSMKNIILPNDSKQMVILQDINGVCYGNSLGFFRLRDLSNSTVSDFLQLRSSVAEETARVGRECVIDRFDQIFIPPDFFEISAVNDAEFISKFHSTTAGHQLLFSIFSICNVVRSASNGWQIRINGKKLLEDEIFCSKESEEWKIHVDLNDEEEELPVTDELVASFVDVFNWAYEVRVTDRLSVLRNIITLYTTSTIGLLNEIDDILDSAKSNFKFYAEESVDEFISIQQEVSSYVLETQREFSELRRNLANNLSRDLFRVFGFLVVSWAGIFLQIERVASVRLALRISLIPVIIYLILSLRAVHGLSQQFNSLEGTREAHQRIYKRQLSDSLFEELTSHGQKDQVRSQFRTDKWIYYILFGSLLICSVYVLIDLATYGPFAEAVESIVQTNSA